MGKRKGRPRKPAAERKTEFVVTKVTPEIKAAIAGTSGPGGEGISAWVRTAINEKLERERGKRSLPETE